MKGGVYRMLTVKKEKGSEKGKQAEAYAVHA